MHRILLIEDSADYRLVVQRALKSPTLEVTAVSGLKEARAAIAQAYVPDLILLDLSLPDGDGFELLSELQASDRFRKIPIYLMTGNERISSKVTAFNLGAEDYLIKPVNPAELRARIEMRLRKASQQATAETLKRGALTLHIPLLQASLDSGSGAEPLELTAKEFKILLYLAQNEGSVHSRAGLVDAIWGKSVHVLDRTVDSHVCSLRRKLGRHSGYIESVPGEGYRFNARGSSPRSRTENAGSPARRRD